MMDIESIKKVLKSNNPDEICRLISMGLDLNHLNGWMMRYAACSGSFKIVKVLLEKGAQLYTGWQNGPSILQLAIHSKKNWDDDSWDFLLSTTTALDLVDGAAVAIIFNNHNALTRIINTGRCNFNTPTTLTGKTVEELAKMYKLKLVNPVHLQDSSIIAIKSPTNVVMNPTKTDKIENSKNKCLSPSVARFFELSAKQPNINSSPTSPNVQIGFQRALSNSPFTGYQ